MKKLNTTIAVLFLALTGIIGQTYLTHQNGFKSAYFFRQYPSVSSFDLYENLLVIFDGDSIRTIDMDSGTETGAFGKPAQDTVSLYSSFLTISPDGRSVWAGFTSDLNADDRIYQVDLETGMWMLKARFPQNFDLEFWNDSIIVSGINTDSWEDPNGIFLLDTTGADQHRMIIEAGGNSSGLAVGPMGDIHLGTSSFVDPNAVYRWDSSLVADVIEINKLDTLKPADAEKLTDLPAGAYDCDVDVAGNLVLNMNQFGGKKVVAKWNGTPGDGVNLDTLAFTSGEWDWMTLIKTTGDITSTEPGNGIITFSFGMPMVDIHAADYPPFVANPIDDYTGLMKDLEDIDLTYVFSDPDDADSLITKDLVFQNPQNNLSIYLHENTLGFILPTGKGSAEYFVTEIAIEANSAGLTVTDTFSVSIQSTVGIEDQDRDFLEPYPNPSNGVFRIKGEVLQPMDLEVYTLMGILVHHQPSYSTGQPIDISHLQAGSYLLKVTGGQPGISKIIHLQ